MIVNCPGCGTHYKHEPLPVAVRARCGRCDSTLDLSRLRPYRIVVVPAPTAEQARVASRHLPVGLDHPSLATTIAENVGRHRAVTIPPPSGEDERWGDQIPSAPGDEGLGGRQENVEEYTAGPSPDAKVPAEPARSNGTAATVALWAVAGAIVGAGAGWAIGGETITGVAVGAVLGTISRWLWLRWPSRT